MEDQKNPNLFLVKNVVLVCVIFKVSKKVELTQERLFKMQNVGFIPSSRKNMRNSRY